MYPVEYFSVGFVIVQGSTTKKNVGIKGKLNLFNSSSYIIIVTRKLKEVFGGFWTTDETILHTAGLELTKFGIHHRNRNNRILSIN